MKNKDAYIKKDNSIFKLLLDFSSDWVFYRDEEGIKYVSKGAKKITGYNPEDFIKNKELINKIVSEDDKDKVLKHFQEGIKSKKKHKLTFKLITRKGKLKVIKHECQPVINEKGEIIGRIGKNVDISDSYFEGKRRKEAEDLIKLIYDEFPEPVCMIDRDFNIIATNKKTLSITKQKRREIVGKKCYEIYQNRNSPCEMCVPREVFKKKKPQIDRKEVVLNTGERRYFETWGFPIKNEKGDVSFVVAVSRDITDRKNLERKAREREEENIRIVEAIPDTLFTFDKNGNIINYKTGGKGLNLFKEELFLNKNVKEILPPPFGNIAFEKGQSVIKGRKLEKMEFPLFIGKRRRIFEARIVPADESSVLVLVRDITKERKLEENLEETKKLYEEIVKNSPLGIIRADINGNIVFSNQKTVEIFGSPSLEETRKINVLTFPNLVDAGFSEKALKVLKTGKEEIYRGFYKSKWGKNIFLRISITPLFTKRKKLNGILLLVEDFTTEKLLKTNLEQNEEKFRAIFSSIKDGIILINEDYIIEDINPAIEEITGYSKKELVGKNIIDVSYLLLPFDEKEKIAFSEYKKRAIKKIKELEEKVGGKIYNRETKIQKKDGYIKYLEENYFIVKLDERKLFVGVMRDKSSERDAFEKLRISEWRYRETATLFRLIADNSSDFIWAKNREGKYIFVNKAYAKILFGSEDTTEPIGKDDNYYCEKIRAERPDREDWYTFCGETEEYDKKVIKEKKAIMYELEGYIRGEHFIFNVSSAPLFDENGNVIGLVGSGRDITKEKLLEKEKKVIEEEQKRLAMVIEQSTEAVVISDVDGNLVYVNPAFEQITGYKAEEVLGKNPRFLNSGAHSKKFYKKMWDTILSGKTWTGVFQNKKKDGSIFYESAIIVPLFDEKGKIQFFAGLKRDITSEKILEEQLVQSQKMEALGTLTGGIAHDFNNFLTVINGYADLLLRKNKKDNPNYKIFKEIKAAGEKSVRLVRQLLAFSRKQIYSLEVININTLISNLRKMLTRLISEDISVSLKLSPDIRLIKADPGQVEQILINLVVNARDAIQEGSIKEKRITIETKNINVDKNFAELHGGKNAGNYVVISVSDTGSGIDKENLKKIFDPFFTTKEKGKGTGLGLSTVYGIIKQNGGFISVYSEKGKGTSFNIYWPATDEIEESEEEIMAPEQIKGGNETILLVEDNEDVLKFTKNGLSEYGYYIIALLNPLDVIPLLKNSKLTPDLMITDIIMPGINGRELVEKVREIYPNIKVIYTSGYTDDYIVKKGIIEKKVNFLSKPYTIREIAQFVRTVLDN